MTPPDYIKLDEIDPEDFGDSLLKLQKSFAVKFGDNSFKDAKTFGDICQIIESKLTLTNRSDCTTQQAFYKIRKAISKTQSINEAFIVPKSKLEDIFPRSNRRQKIKDLKKELDISVDFLSMKIWLSWTILIGFALSLLSFFFRWEVAITGLLFFIVFGWTASKFSKEFDISTVGQLTEKISRENYSKSRRLHGTINKNEIVRTIQDVFIADHYLRRQDLTEDATLGRN